MLEMMRALLVFLTLLTFSVGGAWAQVSETMDAIIGTKAISVSQAAYVVFVASGKLAADATPEQASTLAQTLGWFDAGTNPARLLRSSEYAFLLTRSFALTGGLMSWLFPSPRYAYRDFVARGVFSADGDPDDRLSGPEAVRILGQVMDSLPGGRS